MIEHEDKTTAPVNGEDRPEMDDEESPFLPIAFHEDSVRSFERGVENYNRFVSACYRLTNESHWLNHGTKDQPQYYLQSPGAEALMGPLGIEPQDLAYRREEKVDKDGQTFYLWWCEGSAKSKTLGRRGHFIGYCDSRDQFFNARRGWTPETGEADIRKSAFSNWEVNAVTRLAGLRKPRAESLQAAGLDLNKIQSVDYSGRKTAESESDAISEPQRKRLWAICKNFGVSEEKLKIYLLSCGYTSTALIAKKDYEKICRWVEADRKMKTEPARADAAGGREPGED
jgi:hypothetical protein